MAVKNNRKGDSAMETKSFSKLPYAVMLVMVVTLGLGSEAFGQTSKSDQKPTQVVKTVFTSSDVQPVLIKKTSKTTKRKVKPILIKVKPTKKKIVVKLIF